MLTSVLWRIFQADKFDGCKKIALAETMMCWFLVVYFKRIIRGVYGNKVKWFEFWTINRWIERTICIIVRGKVQSFISAKTYSLCVLKLKQLKWQKFDFKYLIMLDKKYLLCTCFIEYWLTDNSSANVLYKDNNNIIFGYIFRSNATGNCLYSSVS
jgi:hypothetical protein